MQDPQNDSADSPVHCDSREVQLEKIACNIMASFQHMLAHQEQVVIRIGRRTTQIVRFTMFGLVIILVAMLFLVNTFTSEMGSITNSMDNMLHNMARMDENFVQVAHNMQNMQSSVNQMRQYVATMPTINQSVQGMGEDMQTLDTFMSSIELHMASIEQHMQLMQQDVQQMNAKFFDLNNAVGFMGHNVKQMSRPMSMFPNP